MAGLFQRTVKKLRSLAGASGLVKGIHLTFDAWLNTLPTSDRAAHTKQIVAPATSFPKVQPYTPEPTDFDPAGSDDQGDTYLEREKFVARVSGGIVGTPNCELLTPDHYLIHELLLNDTTVKPRFVDSLQLQSKPAIQDHPIEVASLYSSLIRTNYSHFILDFLPRLMYLESAGVLPAAKLIVPNSIPTYQDRLLTLLGYDESTRWSIDAGYHRFDAVYTASFPHNVYWYPNPDACRQIKDRLLSLITPADSALPEHLYISRKNSTFRRVINERKILDRLDPLGFVEVCTEDLTIEAQINLFRRAKTVIAPHGAGLTNILFMEQGTSVIELVGSHHRLPTYVNLAGGLGLRYAYIPTTPDLEQPYKNNDFTMPVDRILRALQTLES